MPPSFLKSPKIGGYRGLIQTVSTASLIIDFQYLRFVVKDRYDIPKEIVGKSMGKAIGVVSYQVL